MQPACHKFTQQTDAGFCETKCEKHRIKHSPYKLQNRGENRFIWFVKKGGKNYVTKM